MLDRFKKVKKNDSGFTIIEVMIVLAIAGLIILIVFLAVPALQRSSRNTGRKGDVSRLGSSATEFVANQNGSLPALGSAAVAGNAQTIVNSAGKLAQYDFKTTPATDGLKFNVVAAAAAVPGSIDNVNLAVKAKCNTVVNDGTTVAGSARQMAIQYLTETSGGTAPLCLDL